MAKENVTDYKIEQQNDNTWSYLYKIGSGRGNIIASSVDELKQKVLSRGLPWNDDSASADVAKNASDYRVSFETLKKITDESVLTDIAKNASDYNIRFMASLKITDESVFYYIAKNDINNQIPEIFRFRYAAVEKISDEFILADIAKNTSNNDVISEVVRKIADESVLTDFAKNNSNSYVRLEAVKKIRDDSVLSDIAKKDSCWRVRLEAVRKIADESVLDYIANNDFDPRVNYEASKKIKDVRIIFFNTETSGLNCNYCKIIELSMLIVENGKVVEEYDEFIDIGERINSNISDITGITNDMLVNEGIDEESVAKDLKERLGSETLMIAHNCQFGLSFVYSLLKRHYPYEADEIVKNVKWLDSMTVLKDRKRYPHKLINAVNHYHISEVNFNRAIDNAKTLRKVCLAMKDERDDLVEYINVFGYNPRYRINGVQFPFIKYKEHYFNNKMVSPNNILPMK